MKHDFIKTLTALSVILAFNMVGFGLTFLEIPEGNRELFTHFIGIIEGAFVGSLVGYYWTRSPEKENPQ